MKIRQTSSSSIDDLESPTAANQLTRSRRRDSTQDDRLKIKTTLDLGLSVKEISEALGVFEPTNLPCSEEWAGIWKEEEWEQASDIG